METEQGMLYEGGINFSRLFLPQNSQMKVAAGLSKAALDTKEKSKWEQQVSQPSNPNLSPSSTNGIFGYQSELHYKALQSFSESFQQIHHLAKKLPRQGGSGSLNPVS